MGELIMTVYYSNKTIDGQIPENIKSDVEKMFTTFLVEYSSDGSVTIKVPERELHIVRKLHSDVLALIVELKKENDVLAKKLARRYGFNTQKLI